MLFFPIGVRQVQYAPFYNRHSQFMCGQDSVVVLLGVPARPMSVNIHANINEELLGRPLIE